ncbi:HSP20-like chaperone [Podospora appendiculata]|uniref:HSP20-like chaperone n=1 Tax=Podospora appendiculata TaxID=314037 RepID=A0AAE0XKT7_9PEZI|nr:HSP20-like chaperone [Podospora appendiculata]
MPFAQGLRSQFKNLRAAHGQGPAADNDNDGEEPPFTPPVDIFSTPNEWTLHVALPGAKKEDVSVNWDPEKATLVISGLVYRPGDEAFLSTLLSGERRVGLFERKIKLPPVGENEKEEVDAERITAKMEDGLLMIVVRKQEKDRTEVKKVDIE